jgi:hypothetical protein
MEVEMIKRIVHVCAILAMALTGAKMLPAQTPHLEGVWDLNVTVVNCQSGVLIRTVRSLQMYNPDGSITETANTFLRGSSFGSWGHAGPETYAANYWFFRYNPDGTFKSFAEGLNKIELSGNGSHFTASGTITDYDATGNVISVGCVTQTARRLANLDN